MKSRLAVSSAVAALAGLAAFAHADTLWNQSPSDLLSGAASQIGWQPGSSGPGRAVRAADDFIVPLGNGQNYQIQRVTARVVSLLGTDPTAYVMELYADANGSPGTLLLQRSAYLVDGFGFDNYRRPILRPAFAGGFDLAPGQRYWISVAGYDTRERSMLFGSYNYGAAQTIGLGAMMRIGTGAWTSVTGADPNLRDLSFAVEGSQRVPGAAPVGLLALCGIAAARRRRGA